MSMSARCFVGLGTNLGDRLALLRTAARRLASSEGVTLRACSQIWETRPVGPGTGPFLNAAVEVHAQLSPLELLRRLAQIEHELGRVRRERWGDRSIDLDLLCAFDDAGRELRMTSEELTLPHPGVHARDFVLVPLLELAPELDVGGRRCASSLQALPEAERTLLRSWDAGLLDSEHADDTEL